MRRIVAALLVASLAFALTGCGGGEPEPAPAPPAEAPVTTPVDPTSAAASSTVSNEGAVFEPFPVTDGTPVAITDALADNQPFMLFFFDDGQKSTNDVRQQIDKVVKDNTGLIELYAYSLGEYATVDSEGRVEVDEEALKENAAGAATVALARDLAVSFTPYVVVVDSQGYVVYRHSGFIDAEMLERQVQRAAE